MNLVFHHFARFGLEMHIGRDSNESKTECMFFPPPQFFHQRQLPATNADDRRQTRSMTLRQTLETPLITPTDDETVKPDEKQTDREGNLYDSLAKTEDIPVADGYVTFTQSFRYLGSLILFDL
jgi:hypothetical protein